ncbi:unnamed protein product [Phytomonas sp. EM1]|nr:unnamed protein product [Phytomonas sp. EM1]|eukprot:CCW61100.1 unnamed protein product [Phytomonas sp. isolate EM1]
MNIIYAYNNKNVFLVRFDESRKDVECIESAHIRSYYVLLMPQVKCGETIVLPSASILSPLFRAYSSCSELVQSFFQSFNPMNADAETDIDCYWNQTSLLTSAAVISTAFSTLPVVDVVNSSEEVNSIDLKSQLLIDFPPGAFFDLQKDRQYGFSFWNLFLCVMYAVTFDSADSIPNSYFCLSQYISRSFPDTSKPKNAVSYSLAVWNEELLWRLINSLLSTLGVVHAAGFHFGGQITTDDILCFAIPRQLSMQLENTLNCFRGKIGHNKWGVEDIKSFIHTINSIILPSAPIMAQTPVHRAFFTLTCIPRSVFSNHCNPSFLEGESYQEKDLNCVGKILLSILEAQKASNVTTDTLVSSELKFFIQRMCGSFPSSSQTTAAPAVHYLTRLQALRLRANSWIYYLLAEETHFLACCYLQSHRIERLSLYEDTQSKGQANFDIQQNTLTLKEKITQLMAYEAEVNEKSKLLEARENELSIREKKLEAMLALYELTYEHLDKLPDAQTSGYSELRRQLCSRFTENGLYNDTKKDCSPSPNSMPSSTLEFTAHMDREQHRFMKGNKVDHRNGTCSLIHHHFSDLCRKKSINEACSQVTQQLGSEPHFSFSVPVSRISPDKLNQTATRETLEKIPQSNTEVMKGVPTDEQSILPYQNSPNNGFSNQVASFYSNVDDEKLFSAKKAEPYVAKLPSSGSSRSITFQQHVFGEKYSIDNTPKAFSNAHDPARSPSSNSVTGTSHTPLKGKSIRQEKPSSGSLFNSPPSSYQPDNRLPSFQRSSKAIDSSSPREAHTNGATETGETSKGCVDDFHDDDKCNNHCTPKHSVPGTLGGEDQSARSKYSTMLSNMKAERTDASYNSIDIDDTPGLINQRRVLVPKLSGVLLDIESFSVPEDAGYKDDDDESKTPCLGASDNQGLKDRKSRRESRTTRVKTELDHNWVQLHYAELEKMQNNFRQDSVPGRSINATPSARTTPHSLKVTKGGHHSDVSRESRGSHSKEVEASTEGVSNLDLTLKRSTEQKQLEDHQGGRGRNIVSPEIEVVTEEVIKCVELSSNKPPAPSYSYPSATELLVSNHSHDDAREPSSSHSTSLINHISKLPTKTVDSRLKQKTPKERVCATKIATPRRGASFFTPPTSSLLNLHVPEKYPPKEQQKGVKGHMSSRACGTDSGKRSSIISATSKLATPRNHLNSSSPSLAFSQALFSTHLQKHIEVQRQPQDPPASPRQKAINVKRVHSASANVFSHVTNPPRGSTLSNTSEVESLNRRKIKRSEYSVRAMSTEDVAFQTPRGFEGVLNGASSRRGPPLQPADISPNSAKFLSENLSDAKCRTKTSSVDNAAQDLLRRLRNNVALTS